jgi:GNAT superfamily N-acetyltransferase
MPPSPTQWLCDLPLSRRLERAEADSNVRLVEARAAQDAGSGAAWIEVAGTYAMYDGVSSPCTQTFGLGLFQQPSTADMERLEAFFQERGAPVVHEVSPMADPSLLGLLSARGYRPIELTSILFRELTGDVPREPGTVTVRVIESGEIDVWERTAAEGWCESVEIADLLPRLLKVAAHRQGAHSFLAEIDGVPVATGSLATHEGVALFAGASTIPEWRHRGAQGALLEARLAWAVRHGCDLAMMCAAPGSSSQRNAERQGFRIAYTRIKWGLAGVSK